MVTLTEDAAQSVSTALLITASRALRESWDRELSPTVRHERAVYVAHLDRIRASIDDQLRVD